VVGGGSVRHETCIGAAVALREAGWTVELDTNGRDEQSAVRYAAEHDIASIVFVDDEGMKNGNVRLRRLDNGGEQRVALSSLSATPKGEGVRKEAAGR
jgi:histidyl-tRNA synthetase